MKLKIESKKIEEYVIKKKKKKKRSNSIETKQ